MTDRTFQAKSIQEAIGRIKAEMGADALILNTRRLPKGPRDPYGADLFEVTAAPPEAAGGATIRQPANTARKPAAENRLTRDTTGNAEEPEGGRDEIRTELVSIRDMLFLFNQAGGMPDFLQMHPECLSLYARLVRAGITEPRVRRFMKQAGGFSGETDPRQIAKNVLQEILSHIRVCKPFVSENGGRQVAAFIGPTGVGKTTTIAKLAAELSLKQKKRIGIISIDSYRIGAVDQLRTYSDIMGLPCLPAFSSEDLRTALARMENREIILLDTAGQSHLDMDRMKELAGLLAGGEEIRTHLVLSATAKREDMKEAAENFATLSPASYVFTKVDETRTRGGLIDQLMDVNLPISFVTNGQRVPEDIMNATRKRILQLVLG